jgi:hypothetical protein
MLKTCIEKWSHAWVFCCEILPHGDQKKEVANSTKDYFGKKFHQSLQYFEEEKS